MSGTVRTAGSGCSPACCWHHRVRVTKKTRAVAVGEGSSARPRPAFRLRSELGDRTHVVTSARDGYVDVLVQCDLEPGWQTARLSTPDADTVDVPLRIVPPRTQVGLVSDIDDTVMVTMLPDL
jgi:phosphatidate phosphatase APP1